MPDTLFLVSEADWRCYEGECISGAALAASLQSVLPPTGHLATVVGQGEVTFREVYEERLREQPLRRVDETTEEEFREADARMFYTREPVSLSAGRPTAASGSKAGPAKAPRLMPTQELLDIVQMCTLAHRAGRGDLVWLSWEGSKQRKSHPCHGSTLLAISHLRAASMLAEFPFEFKHWDLALLSALLDGDRAAEWRASYTLPAVGHFQSHLSGCQEGLGVRESTSDRPWVQEGTRCFKPAHRERWLMGFTKKNLDWVQHLQLPAPGLHNAFWWRTRRPAVDPGADVPSTAASSQGAPAGLRKKPAQSADPHHVPLPRADVIVADASALTSKRQRTALRFNMNLYKWRHFVDTDEEAVLGQSHGISHSFAVQAVCLSPCCARNICVRVSA